jgi:hypothetical protein
LRNRIRFAGPQLANRHAGKIPCHNSLIHHKLRLPVALPAKNKEFFLHFPKQFSLPVAPTGKKLVDSRNTVANL